jgi:hypothetical protein
MTQPRPTTRLVRRTWCVTLVVVGMLALPSIAAAACAPQVRADSRATAELVGQLRASGAAGAADVAELYARARRSCLDMRPARSIALATMRLGLPVAGRRATVRGVPLAGVTNAGGTFWRLDLKQVAVRVA